MAAQNNESGSCDSSAANSRVTVQGTELRQAGALNVYATMPCPLKVRFKAEFEASIPLIRNEISQRDGLGKFEPRLLAATWGWVAQSMSYDLKKVDPETLVDRRFLSQ